MKLGYMMLLVAVGAMLVIAPSAMAGEKGKGHDKNAVYGKVTAVGADSITVAVQGKKDAPAAEPKVITTNKDTTKVFIGETPATLADVKVDARVAVTLDGTTATKIVVMPAHEKKK
jgi:hypothetical protein